MIKQEIIEKISQFFRLTEFEAEKVFDDIFSKIKSGVKDDSIVDIVNFGEFIIKYNNGKSNGSPPSAYKKTIEFLASVSLEDEIGQRSYDLKKAQYETGINNELTQQPFVKSQTVETPAIDEPEIKVDKPESKETITPKVEETKTEPIKPAFEFQKIPSVTPVTSFSEQKPEIKPPVVPPVSIKKPDITADIPNIVQPPKTDLSIEEEFKRKREELLKKISTHPLQDSEAVKKPDISAQKFFIPRTDFLKKAETEPIIEEEKKIQEPVVGTVEEKKTSAAGEEEIKPVEESVKTKEPAKTEDIKLTEEVPVADEQVSAKEPEKIDTKEEKIVEDEQPVPEIEYPSFDTDLSKKSFADYFTEVSQADKIKEEPKLQVPPPIPLVIPREAVELHQEITHPTVPVMQTSQTPVTQKTEQLVEQRAADSSYYIWYKDSEPNATETQTMTYEYELLYQATKEAEYKSKLKIYVSTFIIFFSIVLILLIFSPVIYKLFFTPVGQENIENVDQQNNDNQVSEHKATLNITPVNTIQNAAVTDSNNKEQTNTTEQTQQVQNVPTEQQQTTNAGSQQTTQQPVTQTEQKPDNQQTQQNQTQTQTQQNSEPKIDGVVRNSMGWADEKLKVIYIKLENGKYTIQESAWDSDAKASKRVSSIASLKITGLNGNVVKADLGDKGIWFRARFGEYGTLEEARAKAEELRNKEKVRLQAAILLYFLLYT